MHTRSGLLTRTGTRLLATAAVLIAITGLMLAGRATPVRAVGEPTVTGVTPASCSTAGGTVISVTGTGFVLGAGGTTVLFGLVPGTAPYVFDSTSLQVTCPPQAAGSVSVFATTVAGTSADTPADNFTYSANLPAVAALSPASGPIAGANVVTITGTNLGGASLVAFGTATAVPTTSSATSVTVTAPASSTSAAQVVEVVVTTPAGTSVNPGTANDYTYTNGPTITSLAPAACSTAGGSLISVTGTGFVFAGTSVLFGLSGGTSVNVTSGTTLTVLCPAQAAGAVNVRVITVAGTSPDTPADDFTYGTTVAPTITAINPASGPIGGGNSVTITGTNLSGTSQVAFGTQIAIPTTASASSVTVTVPISSTFAAQVVEVVISTPGGNSGNPGTANDYTYTNGPTVTLLSPTTCSTAGGIVISVSGTGFVVGNTSVLFGVIAGTSVNVTSATSLQVTCPPQAAGTLSVRVTTAAGTSPDTVNDDFSYGTGSLPIIAYLSPASGPIAGGNTITITGTNLSGTALVAFGSQVVAPTTVSAASVTVVVPLSSTSAAQTVEVVVTTPAGPSNTAGTANDYTYTAGPTITFLSPATGPTSGLTTVIITGTGFTIGGAGMTLSFGGTLTTSFTVGSTTSITAISPAHSAGVVNVIVTVSSISSPDTVADDYTYTGASVPAITSISPTSGPIGTLVTLTGSGFTGATSVTVGGLSAAFTVVSDSSLTVTVPAGTASGVVDIRVTGPGGTSLNVTADDFTNTSTSGATTTYTLYFRWSLISWSGIDNISASNAVKGIETGTANPATNDVSASMTAIWYFDGPSQSFKGYFIGYDSTPGANDFTTLRRGISYWIAISTAGSVSWTVLQGS